MADFLTFKKAGLCCHVHGKMNCDKCAEQYLVEGIKASNRRIAELEQQLAEAEKKISEWEAAPDFVKAGDGTLHGAIDYWQERAAKAESRLNWVLNKAYITDSGGFFFFNGGSRPSKSDKETSIKNIDEAIRYMQGI